MKKVWAFVKNYSKIFFFVIVGIIGIIFARKKYQSYQSLLDELDDLKEDHRDEISKIESEREKERKAYKENEERLRLALDSIRRQYEESQIQLSEKKEKEIQKIVKKFGSNPDELAKQLSASTGFKIILPETE